MHADGDGVLTPVIDQGNRLTLLLDAIDRHPGLAGCCVIACTALHDVDVIDRLPIPVVDRQRIPVRGQQGRDMQPVHIEAQAEQGFDDEPATTSC